ncbi:unnamed protein product [Mesocestoides corti]|uniref:SH3 domain-containing protein n=1 Tax=Mesocestoides corti TaxID=53468 RepID=A0A158QST6_MESCO|nr:unnamed protein product [Mesocestoides corti]
MSIHGGTRGLPRSFAASRESKDCRNPPLGCSPSGKILWQHEAEHLSTLVTSANRPPPDPESSLRRLRQLADSKQLTITPVKLMLREHNSRRELLVSNIASGEICECIPLEDIITPIYKESNDPTDSYNNLLMFNVNACLNSRNGPSQHEMHVFQCVSAPAHEIVDALVGFEDTASEGSHEHQDLYAEAEDEDYESRKPPTSRHAEILENGLDVGLTPQQLKEKALIDAEILLLNMCFDDIESYVGQIYKLQRARWQNSTTACPSDDNVSVSGGDAKTKDKKAKKKRRFIFKKRSTSTSARDPKDDMPRVTSNTSLASEVEIPISDDELIDLFEKTKFSIILLSRLQGYVTEPNPPLLTHKLFSMMKQPIDFIRDPISGKPDMAKKVISPLFPEAAIRLIQNSLIEPELGLWRELGDGWCLPKEQWKVDVPTYIPQFKCGFKPQPDQYHQSLFDVRQAKGSVVEGNMRSRTSATRLASSSDVKSHMEFLQYLRKKSAKVAQVKRDFVAESDQEISLKLGEYVEVLDDSLKWNRVRNRRGNEGYAPYTILEYNFV